MLQHPLDVTPGNSTARTGAAHVQAQELHPQLLLLGLGKIEVLECSSRAQLPAQMSAAAHVLVRGRHCKGWPRNGGGGMFNNSEPHAERGHIMKVVESG